MPTTEEISAEELAKLFYRYHESLAMDFECEPESEISPLWELAPRNERKLMVAAARLVLLELAERHPESEIAAVTATTTPTYQATLPGRGQKLVRHRASDTLGEEGKECGC
jgi:hypothetical protein